jgi:hypothetical protein
VGIDYTLEGTVEEMVVQEIKVVVVVMEELLAMAAQLD